MTDEHTVDWSDGATYRSVFLGELEPDEPESAVVVLGADVCALCGNPLLPAWPGFENHRCCGYCGAINHPGYA